MTAVTVKPTVNGSKVDAWKLAMEAGAREGVGRGAQTLLEYTEFLMAAHEDPWGASWAPLSEVTVRLEEEDASNTANTSFSRIGSFRVFEYDHKVKADVIVRRKDRSVAGILNFGNPENKVFGRGAGPIPARSFLPITQGGELNMPEPLRQRLIGIVRQALQETLRRARGG